MSNLLSRVPKMVILLIIICLFIISFSLSIVLGKTPIPITMAIDAFLNYDESIAEHVIIATSRTSRAVIATVIGASLAISGALMQALTRNPLAAPDILGINAGALFFIVFSVTFFSLIHWSVICG